MKLSWIGHSCFRIESEGCSLILDPYEAGAVPGYRPVEETANMLLCSHEHRDHNARESVRLLPAEDANPFRIETLDSFHDDCQGAKRGRNRITILSDGESRIAHLGDLGCLPEPEQLEKLRGLDVVLVPVGGCYTIDAAEAAILLEQIKPRLAVPMHFRDETLHFGYAEIAVLSPFLALRKHWLYTGESSLETTETYSADTIVLVPRNIEKGSAL